MLYFEIDENFKSYLQAFDFVEIELFKNDIRANGGVLLPIEQYENLVELLKSFEIFYYINGRFPYTTALLPIPDGDIPNFEKSEKY